jgi:hypothetical protein
MILNSDGKAQRRNEFPDINATVKKLRPKNNLPVLSMKARIWGQFSVCNTVEQ